MNEHNIQVNNLIVISDNESWKDGYRSNLSALWAGYKQKNPGARMINLDITPNETSATAQRADTLRVGGFSDEVFQVMSSFLAGDKTQLDAVKAIKL
jgi:60 kDa SS-A/Ro ribonucleoprotein